MLKQFLRILAAAALLAGPATATIKLAFGGNPVTTPTLSYSAGGVDFTVQALGFTPFPGTLTSTSQLDQGGLLQRTLPGLGIAGGASGEQVDTNLPGAREGLLLSGSTAFSIEGFLLSLVDGNDTLALYGVDGDRLVFLGYPGIIQNVPDGQPNAELSLLAGQASGPPFSNANGGTQSLTLITPTAAYKAFFFTTREPGEQDYLNAIGQGYRLDTISFGLPGEGGEEVIATGVPEPQSWALLITGFGLVGAMARRRRAILA